MCCHMSSLGVNVPDHDMTFQSLSELLQQSVSPFVASVQAKECGGKETKILTTETNGEENYKYELLSVPYMWTCDRIE